MMHKHCKSNKFVILKRKTHKLELGIKEQARIFLNFLFILNILMTMNYNSILSIKIS